MSSSHLLALATGLLAAASLQAQTPPAAASPAATAASADCPHPFGLADNTARTFTLQNAQGKTTGYVRQRVVRLGTEQNKKKTQTTNTVLLKSGSYDTKGRLLYLRDLTFRCRQDTAFTDGLDQFSPSQLSSFRDRIFVFSPTHLAWPNRPTVGTVLPDGGMSVEVSSSAVAIARVYTKVRQRRVTGQQTITTPAGTFECYKVEAERETGTASSPDIRLHSVARVVDYYAPNVGLVRSEVYDKKGRLEQVRLLTAVDEPVGTAREVKSNGKKS